MNPSEIIVEHATARPLTAEETKHLFELFTMPGYAVLMDLMRISMEASSHVAMNSAAQNVGEDAMENALVNEIRAEHRGAYHAMKTYRDLKADMKAELENPDSHN